MGLSYNDLIFMNKKIREELLVSKSTTKDRDENFLYLYDCGEAGNVC